MRTVEDPPPPQLPAPSAPPALPTSLTTASSPPRARPAGPRTNPTSPPMPRRSTLSAADVVMSSSSGVPSVLQKHLGSSEGEQTAPSGLMADLYRDPPSRSLTAPAATTSPYFDLALAALAPNSNSDHAWGGSAHAQLTPDESGSVQHIEHVGQTSWPAPTDDASSFASGLPPPPLPFKDAPPGYDAEPLLHYRSPEPVPSTPPKPYSPVQPISAIGAGDWDIPSLIDNGGWGTASDTFGFDTGSDGPKLPVYPQIGPGVLPPFLLEPPAWPLGERNAWEVRVIDVPAVAKGVPALPPRGDDEPAVVVAATTTTNISEPLATGSSSIGSTTSFPGGPAARGTPFVPPTVETLQAAIPKPANGHGATIFDPNCMAWWTFPAGDGLPPLEWLTEEGMRSVTEFDRKLGSERQYKIGRADGNDAYGLNEDKLARHYHRFEGVVLPERLASAPVAANGQSDPATATDSAMDDIQFTEQQQPPSPPSQSQPFSRIDGPNAENGGKPSDLWMSSNDSSWVVIPREPSRRSVLDPEVVQAFTSHRVANPLPGSDSVEQAWTLIATMLQNIIFRNEWGGVRVTAKELPFARRIGWDETSARLFANLGFLEDQANGHTRISPPSKDSAARETMRQHIILSWIEVLAYIEDYRIKKAGTQRDKSHEKHGNIIALTSPSDPTASVFGASIAALDRHVVRKAMPDDVLTDTSFIKDLGLATHFAVPASFVIFAYQMQMRHDAERAPVYLEALQWVVDRWGARPGQEDLQFLFVSERSRGLRTISELDQAYALVGLDKGHVEDVLMIPRTDIPHSYITERFQEKFNQVKTAEGNPEQKKKRVEELVEALEIVAGERKSDIESFRQLQMTIDAAKREPPSLEESYRLLGIPADAEDDLIIPMAEIQMGDAPARMYQFQDALRVIGQARNNQSMITFSNTGARAPAAEEQVVAVSTDTPVGLNNIGNTCYLSSLLQYLYTIKELRETVLNHSRFKEDLSESSNGKGKRVGGRLVTDKEIERSTRFTEHLAGLFSNLEYSDTASITPERDLAYLALVTAKDEEVDASDNMSGLIYTATPDTDTTLSDSDQTPGSSAPPGSPLVQRTVPSVLGKRSSEDRDQPMDADSAQSSQTQAQVFPLITAESVSQEAAAPAEVGDSEMTTLTAEDDTRSDVSTVPSPEPSPLLSPTSARKALRKDSSDIHYARSLRHQTPGPEGITSEPVLMVAESDATPETGLVAAAPTVKGVKFEQLPEKIGPPPLPPRPVASVAPPSASDSGGMMFGKQHDVSECLDNCLFQIEAAFDPAKLELVKPGDANLIKQLFYGKARQMIQFEGEDTPSAVHDKDVVFNHILLNVGETGTSKDLYDGLTDYYAPSELESEGRKALLQEVPVELPRMLHVQLQRAQFDRETARSYKSNAYLQFPETLFMDRFCVDGGDPRMEAASALTSSIREKRDRVLELINPRKRSRAESLGNLIDILSALDSPLATFEAADDIDELKADLAREKEAVEREVEQLEREIKEEKTEVEGIWETEKELAYELSSVFIHRGDAGFGHYYLYQRNLPNKPDEWIKFNDQTVTRATKEEVLGDTAGSNANPYLLVYARKGQDLVDAVHRTLF